MKRIPIIFLLIGLLAQTVTAQPPTETQPSLLAERIQKIMDRPEFRHAIFGIEFFSLDSGKPLYQLNADKLFVPASTTKLFTEGTARCARRPFANNSEARPAGCRREHQKDRRPRAHRYQPVS